MFKFLLSLTSPSRASRPTNDQALQWVRDPLSHPALQAMGERELGDLPFRR